MTESRFENLGRAWATTVAVLPLQGDGRLQGGPRVCTDAMPAALSQPESTKSNHPEYPQHLAGQKGGWAGGTGVVSSHETGARVARMRRKALHFRPSCPRR